MQDERRPMQEPLQGVVQELNASISGLVQAVCAQTEQEGLLPGSPTGKHPVLYQGNRDLGDEQDPALKPTAMIKPRKGQKIMRPFLSKTHIEQRIQALCKKQAVFPKQTRGLLREVLTEFIIFASQEANRVREHSQRATIVASDILSSMHLCGFDHYNEYLIKDLTLFRAENKKASESTSTKKQKKLEEELSYFISSVSKDKPSVHPITQKAYSSSIDTHKLQIPKPPEPSNETDEEEEELSPVLKKLILAPPV